MSRCSACGFLFVNPYPGPDEIEAHYRDAYRGATADHYPKAASRRWRAFWRSLAFARMARGKRVLDVGCGGGFMVEAFARLGAEAVGLDISANSIAYARRRFPALEFHCEDLDAFRRRGMRFDFAFSSEVIEHLPGPAPFMELLAECVVPGGFAYVSAPDAGHPAVPGDLASWSDVCPPEHLQWFDAGNLALLFRRYGFAEYRRWTSRDPAHSVVFQRL